MRHFTPDEDKFILENYKVISMAEIARLLCRHKTSTRQRLHLLGYEVPKQIAQHFAKRSQMQPGHISPNKGKTMPPEIREKVSHAWFPKGHRPHNTKPTEQMANLGQVIVNSAVAETRHLRDHGGASTGFIQEDKPVLKIGQREQTLSEHEKVIAKYQ